MATGFSLRIGYISGSTTEMDSAEAYEVMKRYASSVDRDFWFWALKQAPEQVVILRDEVGHDFQAYFEQYSADEGNPLSFHDTDGLVFVSCSGGGVSRQMKEITAMLFCQRIIALMNREHGVPVNLTVS